MTEEEEKEYVSLLADHQSLLRGFIISLMPGLPAADDVVQNANAVLWTKRHDFEPGTNFKAWALRIARLQVMAHLKSVKRQRWVSLSDSTAELIADDLEERIDPVREQARIDALRRCLAKLKPRDQELLLRRYWKQQRLNDFCAVTGLSLSNLKVTFFRLRAGLKRCIQAELESRRPL